MRKTSAVGLSILTAAYMATIGAVYFKTAYLLRESMETVDPDDAERNENSTPRSFILPATPAVAEEQERKIAKSHELTSEALCLSKLIDLGYSIDSFDPSFNASLISATFNFQTASGITPTGRLDTKTKALLHCLR
jgi:hypothetical protein